MHIEQLIQPGRRAELPAARALREVPATVRTFHGVHKTRPALGIYNTSINLVGERMKRATDIIVDASASLGRLDSEKGFRNEVVERYDSFLDSLMEHMDDALNVLLCFYPDKESRKKSPAFKDYDRAIDEYRDHIGLLVNHIKHQQGRLRLVAFETQSSPVLGYYVEAAYTAGHLGPDERLHDGGDTAFSFNYDLRRHCASLFDVSVALSDAIHVLAGTKAGVVPDAEAVDALTEAIAAVASLPTTVYPDELSKPWPRVSFGGALTASRKMTLEFPAASSEAEPVRKLLGIRSFFEADGVTKVFRIPYLGRRWQAKLRADFGWQQRHSGLWTA